MSNDFGTTTFKMDSGERYCHVINLTTGLPEFYPNLYLTTQVRNRSRASSTILATAGSLVVLLRFFERRQIDIQERILTRRFLSPHEVDALSDYMQRKFRRAPKEEPVDSMFTLDELEELEGSVDSGTHYMRLTNSAKYLKWLAGQLFQSPDSQASERIKAIESQITARRPERKRRNEDRDRSLSEEQLDLLFDSLKLDSPINPFGKEVQRRNRLIISMLYYLGIRGGELLNIRIPDINFHNNQIKIVRRADEEDDPRGLEPNTKTLERTLPIGDVLSHELHEYINKDRRRVQNARKNDFLFVTHKSGPTVGQPLSKSGYFKIINQIKTLSPILYALTGHMLRHSWNFDFSEQMDSSESPLSEERQAQLRSYLMGWKPGSGSAEYYNRRFVKQQAKEAGLALQATNGTRLPQGLSNEK
ncbi:tyrosine-type recombinase/integrase [Idiomarina abyssalis]|uniref:tyrosine-type recombinase/integrase n=1 Tax=Idiomarina abyssalis TaxID=86102 RepID=UPI0006C8802B|nr:site-specific integrase [Idiomarina abyssalis]KPD21364.1 integrase [Idiomarina abyssalis]SFT71964.1 Phage integrase family protein [Idiomarina abyssalis]